MFAKKVPCSVLPTSVARLLAQQGLAPPLEVELLRGGNNQTYLLVGADYRLVAKVYFRSAADPRDRLATEYSFVQYLWSRGERDIPQPLACLPEDRVAFYSALPGRKMEPDEVNLDRVRQLSNFFQRINQDISHAAHLKPASEACFSWAEHLERIAGRLEALKECSGTEDYLARLMRSWNQLRPLLADDRAASEPIQSCLSPSDFGFHNALLDGDRLLWLDFEYAGWDDPAKTACDAMCQPALPLPPNAWPIVLESLDQQFGAAARRRAEKLLPAYQIKWCCILLNEFRPESRARRQFAGQDVDLGAQLQKAEALLAQVRW